MNPQEYWDRLNTRDWFFEFSDDPRAIRDGDKETAELRTLAVTKELKAMVDGFMAHHYSGPAFDTPKLAKPPRP